MPGKNQLCGLTRKLVWHRAAPSQVSHDTVLPMPTFCSAILRKNITGMLNIDHVNDEFIIKIV